MTRVLSIIHYPIFGGPHNRNAQVAPFLKREGIETTVLLPDDPGNAADRLQQVGVDVVTIPLVRIRAKFNPIYHLRLFFRFWGDVRRIRHVIRQRRIEIVQINGLVNPQGAIAAHLERIPVVWQILDTFPPMALRRAMMPVVKRFADVLMCTGRQVSDMHPGATNFNDRLVLFYPPVNLSRFKQSQERRKYARGTLGLSDSAFVVGTVGNVNPQKGHQTFIHAAAELKKKIPEAKFVILGALYENHHAYAEGLWKEALSLGLKKGQDLIVRDPGTKVAELEPAFDIFWMTSEPRSEGVPTAVEEAMSLEIPVVATQVGSIAEIVLNGRTGFVTQPHDIKSIVEHSSGLFSDQNKRQNMGLAAFDFASKNFSVESCAQSHLHAYTLALSRSRTSYD